MPELPEVEVVRSGFATHCLGKTITNVEVSHPRAIRKIDGGDAVLAYSLVGTEITQISRRGKFMWFIPTLTQPTETASNDAAAVAHKQKKTSAQGQSIASDQHAIVVHLGMSGQLRIFEHPHPQPRHGRIKVDFSDGSQLWFIDQRTFGYWNISELIADPHHIQARIPAQIAHIAPDLLELSEPGIAAGRIAGKKTQLKRALLDQNIVAGIGNIYCDEMLWATRLHPGMATEDVGKQQLVELIANGQAIMRTAIANGGTSFDDLYVNVNGQSGYFDLSLHAYGRGGDPCDRCGTIMVRSEFAGRASVYCPDCQRL
ncbi:MAG: bifunctional DNA-formamidopyrimidine glycosylase/DNA-(apurinic or apyrimidinic site) lyase [Corynebacterium sp.]|nr:bifunctional DNA-formamidopyrimidine glycosylase/DNA-(apurinic or apyrimidinic site) lyase [Corynebacterium sp.]